jgi:hypothetical protein
MAVNNISTERVLTTENDGIGLFLDNNNSLVNNTGAVERDIEGVNESEEMFPDNTNSLVTNTGVTERDIEGINESNEMFPNNRISNVVNIAGIISSLLNSLESRATYYENEDATTEILTKFQNC